MVDPNGENKTNSLGDLTTDIERFLDDNDDNVNLQNSFYNFFLFSCYP